MFDFLKQLFFSSRMRQFFDPRNCGAKRSSKWPALEKKFLSEHPTCEACGVKAETVHHRLPFHKYPRLELDERNLHSICEKHSCHLMVGHLGSWASYNEDLVEDSARMLNKIQTRP